MNPITQTKNQNIMNERELRLGYTGTESSWHRQYKDSAWIFVGGLNYDLTEGDIICVFSQYGEIANINLVRDKETGRSKGFAFVCYENQKSTVLATDNLNGIKLAGRIIRVDHVEKYKVPSTGVVNVGRQNADQMPTGVGNGEYSSVTDFVREHGCGPEAMKRILELQKANKSSQSSSSANGSSSNRLPSPPRRSQHHSPQHSQTRRNGRSPSVSPPRHRRVPSPPREKYSRRDSYGSRRRSPINQSSRHSPSTIDISPPRRRLHSPTTDVSPPRHRNKMVPRQYRERLKSSCRDRR